MEKSVTNNISYFVVVFIFFLATMLFNHSVIYNASVVLLSMATFVSFSKYKRVSFSIFFIYYFFFIVFAYIQINYIGVYNREDSEFMLGTISFNLVVYLLLYLFLTNTNEYDFALKAYVFACLFLVSIVLFLYFTLGFSSRLGEDITINLFGLEFEYNSNAIANAACVAMAIVLLGDKSFSKIVAFIVIPVFVLAILLSGSKKAALIAVALFLWKGIRKNKLSSSIKGIIVAAFFAGLIIYLVMTIPALYEITGVRFEYMFDYIRGGEGDASTHTRDVLFDQGMEIFYSHPMFGVGINNFRAFNNSILYTHNDYVELLSGVGLVGIIIAYLPKLYILKRAVFELKGDKRQYIFLVILYFIAGLGTVSYYKREDWVILIVVLAILDIERLNKKRKIVR